MSDAPASSIGLIFTETPLSEASPSVSTSLHSAGFVNAEAVTPDAHVESPAVAHPTSTSGSTPAPVPITPTLWWVVLVGKTPGVILSYG